MQIKRIILLFLLSLFLVICAGCQGSTKHPHVNSGVIDLSNRDFERDGPVSLNGEWEFYPNELVTPANLAWRTKPPDFIKVPGPWNNFQYNGSRLGGTGYS